MFWVSHIVFLLLLFVVCVALVFCYFLNFGYLSKTSLKNLEIPKPPAENTINSAKKTQTMTNFQS